MSNDIANLLDDFDEFPESRMSMNTDDENRFFKRTYLKFFDEKVLAEVEGRSKLTENERKLIHLCFVQALHALCNELYDNVFTVPPLSKRAQQRCLLLQQILFDGLTSIKGEELRGISAFAFTTFFIKKNPSDSDLSEERAVCLYFIKTIIKKLRVEVDGVLS